MNVENVIEEYLATNGYGGLCNEDGCGCLLEDLMPCQGNPIKCMPGYNVPCDCGEGCDFHIVSDI